MSWSPPEDYEAPPPAYEEDFDRKVSLAVETSLASHEVAASQDDDEWETWDEATFKANEATPAQDGNASSSSRQAPADRPTSHATATSDKQKPSWYDQAQLSPTGQSSTSGATASRPPLPAPPGSHTHRPNPSFSSPRPNRHSLSLHPDDPDEPLPPFTAVDNVPQGQVNTLSWHSSSRPPSPLASPPTAHAGLPAPRPLMSNVGNDSSRYNLPPPPPLSAARQSIPPPPPISPPQSSLPHRMGPRPAAAAHPARSGGGTRIALPHVQFDPSVAYNNNRNSTLPMPQMTAKASSFYNSSVTASMNRQNGPGLPQPSRNLPQRSAPVFQQHLNAGPYDSSGYHSPKPVRAFPTANIAPPPPLPHGNVVQYQQYPAQNHWQHQPQGGGYPNYYGQ